MFFDEGNCRAVRLLHEAKHFLEACLEKLLAMEKEALTELKNETVGNKKNDNPVTEILKEENEGERIYIKFSPSTSNEIENTCQFNSGQCENKSPIKEKEIQSVLGIENLSYIAPETSSKRKHTVVLSSENLKRSKCDPVILQSNEEVPEMFHFHEQQSNIKIDAPVPEHASNSSIKSIISEDDVDGPDLNSKQDTAEPI